MSALPRTEREPLLRMSSHRNVPIPSKLPSLTTKPIVAARGTIRKHDFQSQDLKGDALSHSLRLPRRKRLPTLVISLKGDIANDLFDQSPHDSRFLSSASSTQSEVLWDGVIVEGIHGEGRAKGQLVKHISWGHTPITETKDALLSSTLVRNRTWDQTTRPEVNEGPYLPTRGLRQGSGTTPRLAQRYSRPLPALRRRAHSTRVRKKNRVKYFNISVWCYK